MRLFACTLVCALLAANTGFAVVTHNTTVTNEFINGSGNSNGAFSVDRNTGVEVGLRAKVRYDLVTNQPQNIYTNDGNGTFFMNAGAFNPGSGDRARWNFEWSINTNHTGNSSFPSIDDLTYRLDVDFDPSAGTTPTFSYDVINVANPNGNAWWDHSFGNNTTGNGAGVEATSGAEYSTHLSTYNLAQNSVNYAFIDNTGSPTFAPYSIDFYESGTYTISLTALQGANVIASTTINVVAAAVPEAGAFVMLGVVFASSGGAYAVRRYRRAA
jgi:hypothetical protein